MKRFFTQPVPLWFVLLLALCSWLNANTKVDWPLLWKQLVWMVTR